MFFKFTVHGGKVPGPGGVVWCQGGAWSWGVGAWSLGEWVPGPGGGSGPRRVWRPPPRDGYCCGWYASYSCLIKIELRTGRPSPLKSYKMSAKCPQFRKDCEVLL